QDFVHRVDEVQLHYGLEVFRQVSEVLFVVLGQDGFEDSCAMGCEELFFEAADGQDLAAQRDFAGHGDVAEDRNFCQRAGGGLGHCDACGGAVLGDGTFGDVDVDVDVAVEVAGQAEVRGAAADIGEGGLRRFLHDFAELAGGRELAFAVKDLD